MDKNMGIDNANTELITSHADALSERSSDCIGAAKSTCRNVSGQEDFSAF